MNLACDMLSPAPGVGSHASVVCLWTGVSSGSGPCLILKTENAAVVQGTLQGTEYLEDIGLEQHGKVQGSQRSPG